MYRGRYRNENVAVKEFLTQSQAESGYDEDDLGGAQVYQVSVQYMYVSYMTSNDCTMHVHVYYKLLCAIMYHPSPPPPSSLHPPPPLPLQASQDESISSGEALFLFRDMRQEVTVLAQLSHPNIVSLLGMYMYIHVHIHVPLHVHVYGVVSTA